LQLVLTTIKVFWPMDIQYLKVGQQHIRPT
jgi:hypothetical protein